MPTDRYLVFTFYAGKALGGIQDYLDRFETVEEALDNLNPEKSRYYQIVDSNTMKVVKEGLTIYKHFSPEAPAQGEWDSF